MASQKQAEKIAAWPQNLIEVLAAVTTMHGSIQVTDNGSIDVEFYDEYSECLQYTLNFTATESNISQMTRSMNDILFERDLVIKRQKELERVDEIKAQALAKLTTEEKRALGLD